MQKAAAQASTFLHAPKAANLKRWQGQTSAKQL
jgi:hypothetical protein